MFSGRRGRFQPAPNRENDPKTRGSGKAAKSRKSGPAPVLRSGSRRPPGKPVSEKRRAIPAEEKRDRPAATAATTACRPSHTVPTGAPAHPTKQAGPRTPEERLRVACPTLPSVVFFGNFFHPPPRNCADRSVHVRDMLDYAPAIRI